MMMSPRRAACLSTGFAAGAVSALALGVAGAQAQENAADVAAFYKGRQVSLLVGSAPGGGYDLYARLLARHFPRHLPGGPDIVVQNMPGAGGLIVANHLASRAPRDGSVFAHVQGPLSIRQLMDSKNVMYDMRRFGWLGSANNSSNVCVLAPRVALKDAKDLLTREIIVGGSGGSTTYVPMFLNAVVGTKFKIIAGYKSTSTVTIALERGEVDGLCGWGWDSAKGNARNFFERGVMKVGLDVGMAPHPELAAQGVPFIMDVADNEEARAILRFAFSYLVYIRPFVTPPDLPAARLKALQTAFAASLADPELLQEAQKTDVEIRYTSPDDVAKALAQVFEAPEAVKQSALAKLREAGFDGQ
jgi:tripartite-type tricarboxylate transporter receptor subunit TctC